MYSIHVHVFLAVLASLPALAFYLQDHLHLCQTNRNKRKNDPVPVTYPSKYVIHVISKPLGDFV